LESKTCVVEDNSALSSGIVPARNRVPLWSVFSPYQARSYHWSVITPTTGKFILPTAGSYLLRQGLLYPGLYFIGTGSPAE